VTEWADQLHHDNAPAHSAAVVQVFFWQGITSPRSVSPPYSPAFPKAKIAIEREEICECDGHTVHRLSQQRLAADWLAPQENDCSWTHSKVSSDWLPSYIKATWLVLDIFKMAGHFPDSPRTLVLLSIMFQYWICETPKTTRSIAFIAVGVILKFLFDWQF